MKPYIQQKVLLDTNNHYSILNMYYDALSLLGRTSLLMAIRTSLLNRCKARMRLLKISMVFLVASISFLMFLLTFSLQAQVVGFGESGSTSPRKQQPHVSMGEEEAKFQKLIGELQNGNVKARLRAIEALEEIGDIRALPFLIQALKDEDEYVRDSAVFTVATFNDPRIIAPLIEALSWTEYGATMTAIQGLGHFKDERVISVLLNIVKKQDKSNDIIKTAVQALRRLGERRAIPYLPALLEIDYKELQFEVAYALDQLGDPRGVPVLIKLYMDSDSAYGYSYSSQSSRAFTARLMRDKVLETLTKSKSSKARHAMIEVLRDDNDVWTEYQLRPKVATALGEMKEEAAIPVMVQILKEEQYISDELSSAVITALGQIGGEKATSFLLDIVQDPNVGEDEILHSVVALGKAKCADAVPVLIQLLQDEEMRWYEDNIRAQAVWALGEIRDKRGYKPLFDLLSDQDVLSWRYKSHRSLWVSSDDINLLEAVIKALGKMRNPQAIPKIIEFMNDSSEKVQRACFYALGEINDPQAIPHLFILSVQDHIEEAAEVGKKILMQGGYEAVSYLIKITKDKTEDEFIRHGAMTALSLAQVSKAISPLSRILKDSTEAKLIRQTAALSLAGIQNSDAIPPLAEVLNYTDKDIRYAAACALGMLKDRRAFPVLIQALEDEEMSYPAMRSLGALKDSRAIPALERMAKEGDSIEKEVAIRTLEQIRSGNNNIPEDQSNEASLYVKEGNVYYRSRQHRLAISKYNEAIEINPTYANAYYNRGNALASLKEFDQAKQDLLKAMELNPALKPNIEKSSDIYKLNLKLD